MLFCPVINMPDYFTRLLRGNMQSSGNLYKTLPVYFEKNPALRSLVKLCMSDIDPQCRVDFFINSLGWHGFRNRIASLFLYYDIHSTFPNSTDPEGLNDILSMEERLKGHTVGNFSRTFLLGLYLKMAKSHLSKYGIDDEKEMISLDESIYTLLDLYSGSKLVKLDLFIIALVHMQYFFGKDTIREYISEGASYVYLYEKLNEKQRDLLMKNLLAYGTSIGETDFFYNKMV